MMPTCLGDSRKAVGDRALTPPIYPEDTPEPEVYQPEHTRQES